MSSAETTLIADPKEASVIGANVAVGARLLGSAVAFLFMAFVFAFFYLRALNTNHLFHPAHTDPPAGFGVAVLACVLGSIGVFEVARRALGGGRPWRLGVLTAWLLALAAVAVQVIEYFNLSFGATTGGGFGSVFFGFTAVFGVFWLGAVYWIETMWAESLRQPGTAASDANAPARLLRPIADSCSVFLYVMAVIELFAFVLLYLVK